ncbi:MAG: hypothetical protein JWO36_545 [Myxococcales bacterium]|nr:hypothetical protein [Myxococcales bacterium]
MQRGGPPRHSASAALFFSVRSPSSSTPIDRHRATLPCVRTLGSLALVLAACGGPGGPSSPASDGVRQYVRALRSNDAHDAYDLLSSDARKQLSFDEFALQWKTTQSERSWQAKVLEDNLKGNPDVGERALIAFSDGKLVQLEREGRAWRLQSELVSRSRAKRPRDAIRLFADAVGARDIAGVLGVLTQRRREGLTKQIEGFIAGLGKRINDKIEENTDRAELRWDENGIRYRIVLRKEDDEWRVDDIYIRAAPKDDESERSGNVEGTLLED